MTNAGLTAVRLARGLLSGELSSRVVSFELGKLGDLSAKAAELVHLLHHYIADEDVRRRDGAYALWQADRLTGLINEAVLEQQGDTT